MDGRTGGRELGRRNCQGGWQVEPILVFILGDDDDFYHFSAIFSGKTYIGFILGGDDDFYQIFNHFSAIFSGRTCIGFILGDVFAWR